MEIVAEAQSLLVRSKSKSIERGRRKKHSNSFALIRCEKVKKCSGWISKKICKSRSTDNRKKRVNICTTTYRNYICDSRSCHNSAVMIYYEYYSCSGGCLHLPGISY